MRGFLTVAVLALARARSLLRQRDAENIAANEPAQVVGCSRFALYRGFRTAYGSAPSGLQRDLRLRRTRALLVEGTVPSATAAETRFADRAHLTPMVHPHLWRHPGRLPDGAPTTGLTPRRVGRRHDGRTTLARSGCASLAPGISHGIPGARRLDSRTG
ncbi:hypothetical protein [Streptomyces sp. NPDC056921]|uniref:hypothetical protein n=1 Tax=Streptomyces sp. NPDC056921 TaxID=3345966 RepID=UPI00362E4C7A